MRATQLWPMLTTPLLSLRGKLRFLAERWIGSIEAERKTVQQSSGEALPSAMNRSATLFADAWDRKSSIASSHPFPPGSTPRTSPSSACRRRWGRSPKMEREYGSLARATAARRRSGLDSVERSSAGARYSQFRAFPGGHDRIDLDTGSRASRRTRSRLQSPVRVDHKIGRCLDGERQERFAGVRSRGAGDSTGAPHSRLLEPHVPPAARRAVEDRVRLGGDCRARCSPS